MAGARETVASNTPHGAVALPKRQHRQDAESSAPVWSLESTAGNGNAEVPLGAWPPVSSLMLVSWWRRVECDADSSMWRSKMLSPSIPLACTLSAAAKCDLHNRERTVCCRDLKGDDERHLVDPDIVRDIIMCVPPRGSPFATVCGWLTLAALALLSVSVGSAQRSR